MADARAGLLGGLKARTLGDLLAASIPPREYLMEPWLRAGESAMLWAATGAGKTMLALSLALAVSGGGELLGWRAPQPRRVLLVDGEMHLADLRERCGFLLGAVEGIDRGSAGRNLTIVARQDQDPEDEFPDLATPEGQRQVLGMAQAVGAELVILDNFSTLANVEDENSAAAFNPVLQFLLRLKQAGVGCLLVHHAGKNSATFRGSSKLAATFEVILGLRPADALALRKGTAFALEWTKYRGRRNETIREREVWLEGGPDGGARWRFELSADEEARELVALVRSERYGRGADLAAALGCSEAKVSRLRRKAVHALKLITDEEWTMCLGAARGETPDLDGAEF